MLIRVGAETAEIQTVDRKIDEGVDLVTPHSISHRHTAISVVAPLNDVIDLNEPCVREPFQMNHEQLGQLPQVELLGRLHKIFAPTAIPRVLLAENFGLREQRQAVL